MKRYLCVLCILIMALLCACGKKETSGENVFGKLDGVSGTPGDLGKDQWVEIYLVKEKCTYNSENVMIQKIQYTYDDKGNKLSEAVDNGVATEVWNEELLIYEYIIGEVDGGIDYSRYWTYDKYGNMLTQEKETPDGKKQLEYNYEYAYENGLPVKQLQPGGDWVYNEYYYNVNGLLIGQLWYQYQLGDPELIECRFEYNSDGTLARIYRSGEPVYDFSYNDQDKLTEFDGIGRNVYRYDSDGNMIAQEIYNWENELEEWREYVYNKDGLLEEEKIMSLRTGKEVYETVKYTYEKVNMSDSEAESYNARSYWRWLMEHTDDYYFIKK